MERASGTVRLGDGRIVERVSVSIVERPPSDDEQGDWYGSLAVPSGVLILQGEAHLRLDDGRGGDILINPVRYTDSGAASAYFRGNGPLV